MIKFTLFKTTCLLGWVILLLATINFSAIAGTLPSHYPQSFIWTGTVDDIKPGVVVIGDRAFSNVGSHVSLHRLKSNQSSIQDLQVGMSVGCVLSDSNQLISLWELPDSLNSPVGPWASGLQRLAPQ